MAEQNKGDEFKSTISSLFSGLESFLTSKTVVGEPIHVGDTIILPLVNVSFGVGAGVFSGDKNDNGGGGLGGKMTPNAVIVLEDGNARLIRVDSQNAVDKLIDMVPGIVSKFTGKKDSSGEEEEE